MAGRKKQEKNRRPSSGVAVRLIIMLAVVAAIVFGVAIFFKVTTIEVQGNTLYSAEDVIAASGIEPGDNLLLVNKRPGLVVHPDEHERVNTLITHIQAYLYQKKEWSPYWENSFAPALCNRIDRNTGGIVIAAKNAETLRVMNQKIRDREVEKSYLCIALGTLSPAEGKLEGFLLKDEAKKQVSVHKRPVEGGRTAVTLYRTLAKKGGLSLVECRLITGRTHQIRAQLAAAGHPLLGDGKYGRERENKKFGRTGGQALYSYKLAFHFTTDAGCLSDLNGKVWTVEQVDFVGQYFPGTTIS